MTIRNFYFEDFRKAYRSCGTCDRSTNRSVVMENIVATGGHEALIRISNPTTTARLRNIRLIDVKRLARVESGARLLEQTHILEE